MILRLLCEQIKLYNRFAILYSAASPLTKDSFYTIKFDELVKSRKTSFFVIPAKAGIQFFQLVTEFLDSGFHRNDDFLRNHQVLGIYRSPSPFKKDMERCPILVTWLRAWVR
jgi:hypothetical protein